MPALRDHLPLAIVTIALSVAVFILFKEVKAAKEQALVGARFAASFQEQQQQPLQLVLPPQATLEDPVQPAKPPAVSEKHVTIKEEIEEIPADPVPSRKAVSKRA